MPTSYADYTGKIAIQLAAFLIGLIGGFIADMFTQMFEKGLPNVDWMHCFITGLEAGAAGVALTLGAFFIGSLSPGIASVLTAMSTSASGVSVAQILGGCAIGGLLTAAMTEAVKKIAGCLAAVLAGVAMRNDEVGILLAEGD